MRMAGAACLIVLLIAAVGWAESTADDGKAVIPLPMSMQGAAGDWAVAGSPAVVYDAPELAPAAEMLAASLEAAYGMKASATRGEAAPDGGIFLSLRGADAALGDEGYALDVTPEGAAIRAPKAAGAFYGTQTLLQLMPVPRRGATLDSFAVPCVSVRDKPRFGWRGLMLDCSRTFLSMDYLRRYVDRLAYYKLNVLHLHLTDDQGWRMEIKKHPKLTEAGARFDPRLKNEVSGFYTQDEMRALVRYAGERNVTLVPEIEMPSHCVAALTAYPDLSCRGEAYNVVPFMYPSAPIPEVPAPPYGVFCAGNERTFEVLEDALAEVIDVFPSRYIHIGGDECPKDFWKACPKCQGRMKAEGLANEEELQSYFVKRIEKFINAKGRTLLGWDEILEGGLAPNAAVMSWRGIQGGIEAARQGHDVVMSPTSHCYLDYDYITTPLKTTYEYEPIPSELTPEEGRRVLGAQGNMWTHLARTERSIDAQIFPRLVALAEVTWSPKERRNWTDFESRMTAHRARLDALGAAHYVERPVPAFAVAPDGTPWAVVDKRPYAYADGAWHAQPGELNQVAFGADGSRYALGATPKPGGYELLEWVGGAWKPVEGGAAGIHLSVSPDGALWLVTDKNALRRLAGGAWSDVPGRVARIAHGPDGARYALSADTLAGGYGILEWTGTEWRSLGAGAAAVELAVAPDGALWAVNSLGVTWCHNGGVWSPFPGLASTVGIAPDGTLLGLGQDPANQHWILMSSQGRVTWSGETTEARWRPVAGSALPDE